MELIKLFFKTLYKNVDGPYYTYLWNMDTKKATWYSYESMSDDMANGYTNIYYGVGLTTSPQQFGRASASDINCIPALWVDIDIAGGEHKASNLPSKIGDILNILPEGLDPSIMVNSGYGYHLYWVLKEPITDMDVARKLLAGWQEFIRQRSGYTIDATHDLARILRVPNTINGKDSKNPIKVRAVSITDAEFNVEELEQYAVEVEIQELQEYTYQRTGNERPAAEIYNNCNALRWAYENQSDVSYPLWLAGISNIARCIDGDEAVHEFSSKHPKYSKQETQRKLTEVLETLNGPFTCDKIRKMTDKCNGCKHNEKAPCGFALKTLTAEGFTNVDFISSAKQRDIKHRDYTDMGNVEMFLDMFGEKFLSVPSRKQWYMWDGNRYVPDSSKEVSKAFNELIKYRNKQAEHLDEDEQQTLRKFIKQCRNTSRLLSFKTMFAEQFGERGDDFNVDPMLFSVANGVIDLRTGELKRAKPSDRITMGSNVRYDRNAKCEHFQKFLNEIFMGDLELIKYMQKQIGYTLTGLTDEQSFVILYGGGANGKSTLLDIILSLMGDYGMTSQSKTFVEKKTQTGGANNDIAAMQGKRFIHVSEFGANDKMDEPLIKAITGGDPIQARFLNQEFFTFKPTAKIMMATNDKPRVSGSRSLFRRLNLVGFNRVFEKHEQDKKLKDKLLAELPGILNWAVEGCLIWQRDGMEVPESVKVTTEEYKQESDVISNWIEEKCVITEFGEEHTSALYSSFIEWCKENCEYINFPQRRFTSKLLELGFNVKIGEKNKRFITGIALPTSDWAKQAALICSKTEK